ncbi:hypothetical protein HK104_008388 [Borealophlyctis nickersoniae]|nr:hypothetical protein HK104_008388 [Borealophlyctis nickersoniae]
MNNNKENDLLPGETASQAALRRRLEEFKRRREEEKAKLTKKPPAKKPSAAPPKTDSQSSANDGVPLGKATTALFYTVGPSLLIFDHPDIPKTVPSKAPPTKLPNAAGTTRARVPTKPKPFATANTTATSAPARPKQPVLRKAASSSNLPTRSIPKTSSAKSTTVASGAASTNAQANKPNLYISAETLKADASSSWLAGAVAQIRNSPKPAEEPVPTVGSARKTKDESKAGAGNFGVESVESGMCTIQERLDNLRMDETPVRGNMSAPKLQKTPVRSSKFVTMAVQTSPYLLAGLLEQYRAEEEQQRSMAREAEVRAELEQHSICPSSATMFSASPFPPPQHLLQSSNPLYPETPVGPSDYFNGSMDRETPNINAGGFETNPTTPAWFRSDNSEGGERGRTPIPTARKEESLREVVDMLGEMSIAKKLQRSTPAPEDVKKELEWGIKDRIVEKLKGKDTPKTVGVKYGQEEGSTVTVLTPVRAKKKDREALGVDTVLTPVRRSARHFREAPPNTEQKGNYSNNYDKELSQLLEGHGHAYVPNKALGSVIPPSAGKRRGTGSARKGPE